MTHSKKMLKVLERLRKLQDWRTTVATSDECSSGPLKLLTKLLLGKRRNWGCICLQHDFDYRFGWKYGISRKQADTELKNGVIASGHPKIAWAMWIAVRLLGWRFYKNGS